MAMRDDDKVQPELRVHVEVTHHLCIPCFSELLSLLLGTHLDDDGKFLGGHDDFKP